MKLLLIFSCSLIFVDNYRWRITIHWLFNVFFIEQIVRSCNKHISKDTINDQFSPIMNQTYFSAFQYLPFFLFYDFYLLINQLVWLFIWLPSVLIFFSLLSVKRYLKQLNFKNVNINSTEISSAEEPNELLISRIQKSTFTQSVVWLLNWDIFRTYEK